MIRIPTAPPGPRENLPVLRIRKRRVPTPVGDAVLAAHDRGLVAFAWPADGSGWDEEREGSGAFDDAHPLLQAGARQLDEYFRGRRARFDLPLDPAGTEFQRRVWNELLRIPFGSTRTYGELARSLGQPSAARAVGAANGSNPLCLFIPCHRVVPASGGPGGYSGGASRKQRLLEIEREYSADSAAAPYPAAPSIAAAAISRLG